MSSAAGVFLLGKGVAAKTDADMKTPMAAAGESLRDLMGVIPCCIDVVERNRESPISGTLAARLPQRSL